MITPEQIRAVCKYQQEQYGYPCEYVFHGQYLQDGRIQDVVVVRVRPIYGGGTYFVAWDPNLRWEASGLCARATSHALREADRRFAVEVR